MLSGNHEANLIETRTQLKLFLPTAFLLSAFLVLQLSARADFTLPILNPVSKIISVPSNIDPSRLERFSEVKDLVLEIRMVGGNLLPGRLLNLLQREFDKTPKRIILSKEIRSIHAEQLRQLDHLEIQYEAEEAKPDSKFINQLYSLGPMHKVVVLNDRFDRACYAVLDKLKHSIPAMRVSDQKPGKDQIDCLATDQKKTKVVFLPANVTPDTIVSLTVIRPLRLELRTKNNRLDDEVLKVLVGLKGVDLTLVVNGRLTLENAKKFTHLERFRLKVELDSEARVIPGLVQLLNRINPP